jgi:hypothetical protein
LKNSIKTKNIRIDIPDDDEEIAVKVKENKENSENIRDDKLQYSSKALLAPTIEFNQ